MLNTEIFINGQQVDLFDNIGFSLNYSIADITKPDKRNSSFSKTIKLPGSKNNNNLFSHIYEVSKESLSTNPTINFSPDFNPNLKAACEIYVDGLIQIRGFAQLLEVNINEGRIEYEISVLGSIGNIFNSFADIKLQDLDLSEYDHIFNTQNQRASWTATTGTGYVYPLIELGYNNLENEFDASYLLPAIYVKEYIDKIFDKVGYTYTSEFFDSDFFKRLIIPFTSDLVKLNQTQLDERKFLANTPPSYITTIPINSTYKSFNNMYRNDLGGTWVNIKTFEDINPSVIDWFRFDNDSVSPAFDTNNVFNIDYGSFSPYKKGYYDLIFDIKGAIRITLPSGLTIDSFGGYFDLGINTFNGLSSIGSNGKAVSLSAPVFISGTTYEVYFDDQIKLTGKYLEPQNTAHCWFVPRINPFNLSSTSNQVNDSVSFELIYDNEQTRFYNIPIVNPLNEGETIFMNSVIPKEILVKDFFKSIITLFNLYVDIDPNNESNLIIEPLINYYQNNNVIDWTDKLDYSKEITIKPVSEIEGKDYVFTYKPDTDYYNETYTTVWDEIYGERNITVNNDFVKGIKKFEVIFSPTPSVGNSTSSLVIPKIYKVDENTGVITPKAGNIRLLYYGGLLSGNWTYKSLLSGDTYESQYPYAGHLDNPLNPTIDILWQEPQQIYWTNGSIGSNYTNNNLYNKYYKQFIEEITDKDSKIVTAYFNLTPLDIYQLNFSNFIFVDGINYRLNKIVDYNPINRQTTKVELSKIKSGIAFSASTIELNSNTSSEDVGIIEGGLNEVRSIQATGDLYILDGGEDTVRPLSASTNTYIVDGGSF